MLHRGALTFNTQRDYVILTRSSHPSLTSAARNYEAPSGTFFLRHFRAITPRKWCTDCGNLNKKEVHNTVLKWSEMRRDFLAVRLARKCCQQRECVEGRVAKIATLGLITICIFGVFFKGPTNKVSIFCLLGVFKPAWLRSSQIHPKSICNWKKFCAFFSRVNFRIKFKNCGGYDLNKESCFYDD